MIDGLTVTKEAFSRTVRLVSTARLRPPVLEGLVGAEDILALAEIEGATSTRLIAQDRGTSSLSPEDFVYSVPHAAFINASFAYAKPRQPNRYNGADLGAWYAALETETCLLEVVFHMTEFLSQSGDFNTVVDYAEMWASMSGDFLDLRNHPDHPSLDPNPASGYPIGNAVAENVRAAGLNGIIYPSIRHKGGTCIAALRPTVVQSAAPGSVFQITWSGSPNPTIKAI
jgi:RES domain-containing protein